MAKYWIFNGEPVTCDKTGKKLEKFESENDHLAGHEATQAEHDAKVAEKLEAKQNPPPNLVEQVAAIMAWIDSGDIANPPQSLKDMAKRVKK